MKIEHLMAKIKAYIDDPSSQTGYGMATIIENYIVDYYEFIEAENRIIARSMNDDLIDICEKTEPGLEGTEFYNELTVAYEEINSMLTDDRGEIPDDQ